MGKKLPEPSWSEVVVFLLVTFAILAVVVLAAFLVVLWRKGGL